MAEQALQEDRAAAAAVVSPELEAFVAKVKEEAAVIFDAYASTRTITANGTVGFVEGSVAISRF